MRRYLIVDDNRAFADNLAEILVDAGAEVDVAALGAEALVRVTATRYDAVVTDMRMPMMGGTELIRALHRLDPGLPAVVVTAYTHDDELSAAWGEGLLAVLPKPVPMGQLIELLGAARRGGLLVIVEDDPVLLDNLTEVLRTRGFAAVTAMSVLETEGLGDVRPFAALVDLRVPGGADGVAMRRLADRFPGLPMLVVTAHAESPPPAEHVAVLIKPIRTTELLDAVEKLYPSVDG